MKDSTENKKVVEMSRFIATMVCLDSHIRATGEALTDEEFMQIYNSLPDTVILEFEQGTEPVKPGVPDNKSSNRTGKNSKVQSLIGDSGSLLERAREEGYDDVSVVLELDNEMKVRAFKSSPLSTSRTPVAPSDFTRPESVGTGLEVYQHIIDTLGDYAVFSESIPATVSGVTPSRTTKVGMRHLGKTPETASLKTGRMLALEDMVKIECRSLFSPSKATPLTFISSKTREQLDMFLQDMQSSFGYDKEHALVILAGLFGIVSNEDVEKVLEVINSDDISPENLSAYNRVISSIFQSMSDSEPLENLTYTYDGTLDMERAVCELASHNKQLESLLVEGEQLLAQDAYMKVLLKSNPEQAILGILSSWIPMTITDFNSLAPRENFEFIWELMECLGGKTGNSLTTVTVKDCDVVAFGKR